MNNALAIASIVIKELYRRKDFYVLFVLTAVITLLMGSLNFFNDDKIVRYLKEICLLLIWISALAIAVGTSARQIPSERENRTIFPLLAKPITRGQMIAGKFLGCWLACGAALIVFYLFFGVISASREHQWPLASYFQALWLHWWMLAVVIAIALLGSLVFAAPSSNATICLLVIVGILLLGRHLNKIALQMADPMSAVVYGVYFLIPHLELFDVRDLIVHNWEPINWLVFAGATLYAAAYTVVFLFAAWLVFRRQPLA
jgi:ABC-type transport system involved in multi-copper enzyme maturation permease subunit